MLLRVEDGVVFGVLEDAGRGAREVSLAGVFQDRHGLVGLAIDACLHRQPGLDGEEAVALEGEIERIAGGGDPATPSPTTPGGNTGMGTLASVGVAALLVWVVVWLLVWAFPYCAAEQQQQDQYRGQEQRLGRDSRR